MKSFSSISKVAAAVGVALALSAGSAMAQEGYKIAYVNPDRIMNESAPAKAAQKKLNADYAKHAKELKDMFERLKQAGEKFEKDMPSLTESDRLSRQRELAKLSQEYQEKRREYLESDTRRRNEELARINERVMQEITKLAKAEKIDLIVQDAMYYSDRVDITERVIRAVNK